MPDSPSRAAAPPRQRAFQSYLDSLFLVRMRLAMALGGVLTPLGIPLDRVLAPEQAPQLAWVRLVSGAVALSLLGLSLLPALARRPRLLGVTFALGLGALGMLQSLLTGGLASPYRDAMGLYMVLLALVMPWSGPEMAAVCGALVLVDLVPMWVDPASHPRAEVQAALYHLGNAALISVAGAFLATRVHRREFAARADLEWRTRELREATGNLRATVGQLREADRARNQLFANVSHELRTPLTVLRAVLEELAELPGLPPEVARRLGVMRTNAQTLLGRINDLLELARAEAGRAELRREPVVLTQVVEGAVAEQLPFAERCGVWLVAEQSGAPVVAADLEKLETVLRNLLSNALKFTPEGGRVVVRCRAEGDSGVLEVEDTGVGVRPEDRERIFERFFTRVTDSQVPGMRSSGIGLPLVRELVQLHGGEVSVEAAAGQGSLFRVRLPLLEGRSSEGEAVPGGARRLRQSLVSAGLSAWDEEPTPLPMRRAAPSAEAPRVLVVEDHPDLRRFLVEYLGTHYQVDEASDGQAALERVRAVKPDLVVADVMMPRLSGRALAQALKADPATRDIPLLLLTAQRGADVAVQSLQEGADDFVFKPFSPRELLARVRAQLRVRELSRQLSRAQRMAMLGTLSAGLAHEVRNPINAIVNALTLVREGLAGGPSERQVAEEMVGIIDEASRRIVRIVDDLLGFSRREESALPRDWSPDASVESTLKLLQHRLGTTAVQVELVAGVRVRGYPDRLDQVVMNLLDNALHAAGPRGTVRVRTELRGQEVGVHVEDDGPGIAPEVLPRIFDPFFTTREVGQGTGLGLHLSRQIAEAHGGSLAVESRPGQGAAFTLWLPMAGHLAQAS